MTDEVLILTSKEFSSKDPGMMDKVRAAQFVFVKTDQYPPYYYCVKNRKIGRPYYRNEESVEKLKEEYEHRT